MQVKRASNACKEARSQTHAHLEGALDDIDANDDGVLLVVHVALHTPAYVSVREHTRAYVSIREHSIGEDTVRIPV